jgi:hypothetical protein
MTATHNSHERSQQFEDVREKIEGLKPQLDKLKQNITTTKIDEDPDETRRRAELARCVRRLLAPPALIDGSCSALEEIEKESQILLEKGVAAQFIDKGADSGKVVRLIDRLREAISNYKVNANCFVAPGTTHRRAGIATTRNLQPNHRSHRKGSLAHLSPPH